MISSDKVDGFVLFNYAEVSWSPVLWVSPMPSQNIRPCTSVATIELFPGRDKPCYTRHPDLVFTFFYACFNFNSLLSCVLSFQPPHIASRTAATSRHGSDLLCNVRAVPKSCSRPLRNSETAQSLLSSSSRPRSLGVSQGQDPVDLQTKAVLGLSITGGTGQQFPNFHVIHHRKSNC
jgi:hypothetical protein